MVIDFLREQKIDFKENIQLKDYSNFKVGGLCKLLVLPKSEEEIVFIIKTLKQYDEKFMVLGKGANVLFLDEGYDGIIIKLGVNFSKIKIVNDKIICDSGVPLSKLCNFALKSNLTGLEFSYGIPGTVGGAVYMNAGAYDGEMKDVVTSVRYVDENGQIKEISGNDLCFGYRKSFFTDKNFLILTASYTLQYGENEKIKSKMNELFNKRVSKQPYYKPSAGSTFKRPEGSYASFLIDSCGLKGKKIGGAMVSDLHAGFIINDDNATSSDILNLIEYVKNEVLKETGYSLECEVKIIEK